MEDGIQLDVEVPAGMNGCIVIERGYQLEDGKREMLVSEGTYSLCIARGNA